MKPEPRTIAAMLASGDSSLLDLVDNVINKGIVLNADVLLGVANVDLIYLRLSALLCAADRVFDVEKPKAARASARTSSRAPSSPPKPRVRKPAPSFGAPSLGVPSFGAPSRGTPRGLVPSARRGTPGSKHGVPSHGVPKGSLPDAKHGTPSSTRRPPVSKHGNQPAPRMVAPRPPPSATRDRAKPVPSKRGAPRPAPRRRPPSVTRRRPPGKG